MCSVKEKRKYLESYQELILEFNREMSDADFWYAKAYSIGASKLDESGVTKTSFGNFKPIDKYLEISERCINRAEEIDKRKLNILNAINRIDKQVYRKVLTLHYVDDYGFHDISNKLFLNQDYVYHVHSRALKEFEIPKEDRKCQF